LLPPRPRPPPHNCDLCIVNRELQIAPQTRRFAELSISCRHFYLSDAKNTHYLQFCRKTLEKTARAIYTKRYRKRKCLPLRGGRREGALPSPPCICDTSTYTVALLRRTPIIRRFALQRKVLIKPPYQWRQCRTYYLCCVCKGRTRHFSFPGGIGIGG